MAYVSRLPRGAYYDPPATDEHVGPGTYQSLNTYSFNASASPFNTSSPRQTLECFNKEAMKNPGIILFIILRRSWTIFKRNSFYNRE